MRKLRNILKGIKPAEITEPNLDKIYIGIVRAVKTKLLDVDSDLYRMSGGKPVSPGYAYVLSDDVSNCKHPFFAIRYENCTYITDLINYYGCDLLGEEHPDSRNEEHSYPSVNSNFSAEEDSDKLREYMYVVEAQEDISWEDVLTMNAHIKRWIDKHKGE